MCDGLAALHAAAVLHRDVKPNNVLLQRGDDGLSHTKLGDFGLTRVLRSSLTHTGAFTGTFEYAAPEVAAGEPATAATDLYAIGIVLYELLCGVTPFHVEDPVTVVQRHQSLPPPRLHGVPESLWELISWLLAKQPTQRPPNAAAVREALTALAPSLAGRPAAVLAEPRERPGDGRDRRAAGAALAYGATNRYRPGRS